MNVLAQDLRFGMRQLRRNPGFTAAAIFCLALGIGANTSAFSFAWGVLFRPPPVTEPNQLVQLFVEWENGLDYGSFSYPDYIDVRDRGGEVLEVLTAETAAPVHLSTGGKNERVWASMVSMNYFSGLGVPMALGRGFTSADGSAPSSAPLAVLDHRTWASRFASDPSAVGREISLNGHVFTVVGVVAERYLGMNSGLTPDIYVPLIMQAEVSPGFAFLDARGAHGISSIVGRRRQEVSFEQTQDALAGIMAQLQEEFPDSNEGKGLLVLPEAGGIHPMVRGGFVNASLLVFVVVGFVLLLACANVAGLLIARAAARRREIGIRMALGGVRSRLVRQLLAESCLLAALAGIAGLLLSIVLERTLTGSVPQTDLPIYMEYQLQPQVLLFGLILSIVTAMLFGAIPALQATRPDLIEDLKEGTPGQAGRRSSRLRQVLVVGQVVLSFVLLVSAGFVLRSLQAVNRLDPGFVAERQLVASIDLGLQGYDEPEGRAFQRDLRQRLESLPEIEAVGFARILPLNLSASQSGVVPEGHEGLSAAEVPAVDFNVVDHGYFVAAGVRLTFRTHLSGGRHCRHSASDDRQSNLRRALLAR